MSTLEDTCPPSKRQRQSCIRQVAEATAEVRERSGAESKESSDKSGVRPGSTLLTSTENKDPVDENEHLDNEDPDNEDPDNEDLEEEEDYGAVEGLDLSEDEIFLVTQRYLSQSQQDDDDDNNNDDDDDDEGPEESDLAATTQGNDRENNPAVTPSPPKGSRGDVKASDVGKQNVSKQLWAPGPAPANPPTRDEAGRRPLRQVLLDSHTKPRSGLPPDHGTVHYSAHIVGDEAHFTDLGGSKLVFKKGETYWTKPTDGVRQFECYIDDFTTDNNNVVHAVVRSYHALTTTFIGKHAHELIKSELWRNRCRGLRSRDKVEWKSKILHMIPEGDKIRLSRLGKKVEGPVKPFLLYDISDTKYTESKNFSVAYLSDSRNVKWKIRTPRRKPTVLDLFAGAGGMTLGLERAGFAARYLVENDPSAVKTLRKHFVGSAVFKENVEHFLENARGKTPGYPKVGEVDHVQACPPCQGFSTANRNGGRRDGYNRERCLDFLEAMDIFRPRSGCFENVTGMLRWQHSRYVERILARLIELGYQVRLFIVDASDHGDPQNRRRLIIFAALFNCHLPEPPTRGLVPKKTVAEVLDDLLEIDPVRDGEVILPNGTKAYGHYKRDGVRRERDHLSQCIDEQCRTIRCQRGVKHPIFTRDVTVLECKRLQSFPDDYQLFGTITSQRRQIGNAVPVNLAAALGVKLMETHAREQRFYGYGC